MKNKPVASQSLLGYPDCELKMIKIITRITIIIIIITVTRRNIKNLQKQI
jgi:hypothetical protein